MGPFLGLGVSVSVSVSVRQTAVLDASVLLRAAPVSSIDTTDRQGTA